MDMDSYKAWVEIAKDMGMEGDAMSEFAKRKEKEYREYRIEREEREREERQRKDREREERQREDRDRIAREQREREERQREYESRLKAKELEIEMARQRHAQINTVTIEQNNSRYNKDNNMKIEELTLNLQREKEKVYRLEEKIIELNHELRKEKEKTQQLQERLESKLANVQETMNMLVDMVIKKQKLIDTEDDMKKHVVEKNIVVTSEDKIKKQNCKQQVVKVSHCTYCKKTGHSKKNCYKL